MLLPTLKALFKKTLKRFRRNFFPISNFWVNREFLEKKLYNIELDLDSTEQRNSFVNSSIGNVTESRQNQTLLKLAVH